jgi:acylphosphatase
LSEKAYDVRVSGKVQRAGYRRFILEKGQELGLSGHVRNEPDGSVAIFVQGEEGLVEQFLEMIKEPQLPVSVKGFEVKAAELNPNVKFFDVEFGSLAEELQEGFGSMEKEFKNYRQEFGGFVGEFRDYRGEFRSFAERTDKNFETLAQKYGEISEKLTEVLETLQRESADTRKELTRAVDSLTELVKRFIGQT